MANLTSLSAIFNSMVTTWACPDGEMDRISKLPKGILHHILSFLTLKQVKQLSLLSKTWKQVSATHPILNFTQDVFLEPNFNLRKINLELVIKEQSRLKQNLLTIFNAVDQSLRPFHDRRLSINEFELSLTPQPHSDLSSVYLSRIYQWIQQAIDSNVQILTISTGFDYDQYKLLQCDLFSRSFNTSLKKLSLQYVRLTDQLPQSLFTNLEVLTLSRCCGLMKINISGPTKLKKINLSCNDNLELVHIEALSLVEALFYGERLKVVDIRQCKNIRYVTMINITILAKWLDEGLGYYPALESLHLSSCYQLKVAKISSNNLKSLELYFLSDLAAIDLNTPSLTEFTYYGGNVDFSSNVSALASATVYFYPYGRVIQKPLYLEHVKLLSKFNGWCKVNLLYNNYNRDYKFFIIPREVRKRMVSPLCNVVNLEITITGNKELKLSTELIDSLFWIFPHREILQVKVISPSSSPADKHKHTFKSFKDKTCYEEEFSSTGHDGLATSSKVAKISSNNLKSLDLYCLSGLAAIDLNTPSLTEFTYNGGNVDFSSNVSALASATVNIYPNERVIQEPVYLEHVKLLSKFNGWCKVNLNYDNYNGDYKFFIIPREVRERMVSPLRNVDKLEITIRGDEELELTSTELIDSLFWISPHPEILLVEKTSSHYKHKYKLKSSKDETYNEEEFCGTGNDGQASISKVLRRSMMDQRFQDLENVIKEKSRLKQNLLTIFNAVDQSLTPFHDRRLSINEFELSLTPQPHRSDLSSFYLSRIYQWIQQAIDSNVQILTISTGFDCGRPTPPQCDLFCRSFNTSLKKLSLQYVSLTDQLPQSLFTNLEVLTISRCCGLRKIDISGPTKLKKIDLSYKGDLELVHIEALSLIEALFYCDSLKVLDIRQCKNIRYITMKYMTILAKWLDEGLDYYPALESLHLSGCYELKVAKISSNNLKSLELYFLSGLAAIDLNTPSLTEFTYYGGNVDFCSNVSALASATVYFYPNYAIQAPLDLEHVKLLSKFNGWCKVKVLYYNRHEKFFIISREVRERMVPPLCNVEKLEITIRGDEELELTSTELIDSLFWISPHPEILLVKETSPSSSPADKHKHTFKSFKDKTFYEEEFSYVGRICYYNCSYGF